MGNSISGSFGLDITPLKKAFVEAEAVARAGGDKVARTLQSSAATASRSLLQNRQSFDRMSGIPLGGGTGTHTDPMAARRARNSAAGFAPAPAGKYSVDEEGSSIGGRRSAFGGIQGLGRAVTTFAGIRRIATYIEEANKDAEKLRDTVIKDTAPGASAFSGGLNESRLQSSATTLDELHRRDLKEGLHRTGLAAVSGNAVRTARHNATGDTDQSDAEQQTALRKVAADSIVNMTRKQNLLNAAERESLDGYKRKGELQKADLENAEKLYDIAAKESAAGLRGHSLLADAENERYRQQKVSIDRASDHADKMRENREYSLDDTRPDSGLTESVIRGRSLNRDLTEAKRQRDEMKGGEGADEAGLNVQDKQRSLDVLRFQEFFKPPGQRQQEQLRATREAAAYKQMTDSGGLLNARRDMSGNVIGGTDPISGESVDKASPWPFANSPTSQGYDRSFGRGAVQDTKDKQSADKQQSDSQDKELLSEIKSMRQDFKDAWK